ncbi:MAG TPA: glycosyltransferase family 39 protein, partial [Gemmatimonadales bacterium]|nr:glycosyltransferase family 39 protein [Gemmatimonadales bacterium]
MTPDSRTLGWGSRVRPAEWAWAEPTPRVTSVLLGTILLLAVLLRLYGVPHDLPFSYFHDEMVYVNRAMAMGTGDLNPHWFNKPAFLMYLLLFCYGVFFVLGWLLGQFASPEAFGAYFMADQGAFILIGRLVMVAFGAGAVYVSYLITRRALGSAAAALGAALMTAVLLPAVVSSYIIESDLPSGFFVALSVYFYLRTRDDPSLWPLLLAAAFAGVATGTKYYGVIVLPVFGLAELARPLTFGTPWPRAILRATLLVVVFVGAFFVVSPYHFLDPTFGERILVKINNFFSPAEGAVEWAPDTRVAYKPGFGAIPGAAAFFFERVLRWDAIGWALAVLAALGMVSGLVRRETRWASLVVAGPMAIYVLLASTAAPYHIQPPHLNAVLPLLAVFVFPGAVLLARGLGLGWRTAPIGAAVLVVLAVAPSAYLTVEATEARLRPDSRTVAARWAAENLPRDAMILLDHYGPVLPPNAAAVERLQARLDDLRDQASEVGSFDAFTEPEARRLAVLRRHPIEDGFNVDRLNHPWWLPREMSDEELLSDPGQWQMGNPLWSRVPDTLEEYR